MERYTSVRALEPLSRKTVLTIGNFDGVHLGHQQLLGRVIAEAKSRDALSCLLTFSPHPRQVLYPEQEFRRLFDYNDQAQMLEKIGLDVLVVEPFSRALSQLKPDQFLRDWIYRPLVPEKIVVGYDFSFGAGRAGTLAVLEDLAESLGFEVELIHPHKEGSVLVSSSRIKKAIEEGETELAQKLLGRPFYLKGLVEKGAGRGKQIGFPTANLSTQAQTLPKCGVYSSRVRVDDKVYDAVTNVGYNPTFLQGEMPEVRVESHLLDFSKDIYGQNILVEFGKYIRPEKRFSGMDDLKKQIDNDIKVAQMHLEDGI
jgi:riboflavin kinase/FMN adenylyltransferase